MDNISEFIFYIFSFLILIFLIISSAIISASEVAFFSLSPKQLSGCKESSSSQEIRVVKILESGTNLLSTIIILGNLVNIAFVIFSNYLLWKFIGKENITNFLMLIFTIISAFCIVLFGELIPKMYGNHNNLFLAKKVSGLFFVLTIIFKPISVPLIKIGGFFGKNFTPEKYNLSPEQLNKALELTLSEEGNDQQILKSIANFGKLQAKQIMTPRTDITSIDISIDFHKLISTIYETNFSRFPVYEKNIDNIKGTIYIKDLMPYIDENKNFKWNRLLRESFFIPETKKLDSLLLDFIEKRIHIAIVADEYGGTSGLITMEDIIQKIIGNIGNEGFEIDKNQDKSREITYVFDGKTYINDFCQEIDEDPDIFKDLKGESQTLAGLILEINGKFPKVGNIIKCKNFVFTIVSLDSKRIKKVKVSRS